MLLIYVFIYNCLNCANYNENKDDLSYFENVILCEQKSIEDFQPSPRLIPGNGLCAQFISLEIHRNEMTIDNLSILPSTLLSPERSARL